MTEDGTAPGTDTPEPPAKTDEMCPSVLQDRSTAVISCSHPAGHSPLRDGAGRYWKHGQGYLHWDRLPDYRPPADTQQDGDDPCCTIDGGGRCNDCPALAARPSADTEALRTRVEGVRARLRTCAGNAAGQQRPAVAMAYDDAAEWLRRALAGDAQ